jgi:integrase
VRGVIEPRGPGRWRVRVYAGREAGRVRWVSRTVLGGKRAAQSALANLVAEVEGGRLVPSHPMSVGELLDRWLEDVGPHRSAYTLREYRRMTEKNIKPAIGALRLDRLTARQLDAFYKRLSERGLSAASVRRHHSLLHAVLGRAVKWGLVSTNPADRATSPGPVRSTATAPSARDVQRLLAAAEVSNPSLAAAIALAAVTGARRGELCALRWSDVDWRRRTLRIARSLTVIGTRVTEGPTKTHQRRDIAIGEALGTFLAARQQQQRVYAAEVGVALVDDPHLLSEASDGSSPFLPDHLTDNYVNLTKRLGTPGHFHELRHFSATEAIASGADVRTVAGRLGHADATTTLRIYAHALEARDRELAGLLDSAVLGTMKGLPEADEADAPAPSKLDGSGQFSTAR